MRCPKCNYNSFDYNIKCDNNKCNKDWSIQRNLLGLNELVEPKNVNFFDVANARLAEEAAAMNAGFESFPEVDIDDKFSSEAVPNEPPKPRIIDENAFPTPDPSNMGAMLTSDASAATAFPQANTGQDAFATSTKKDYVEIAEISPDATFFPEVEISESDDFAFPNPVEASIDEVDSIEGIDEIDSVDEIDEDFFPEPIVVNAKPVESPMTVAEPMDATIYPQSEFRAAEPVAIDDIFGIDDEFEAVEVAEFKAVEPVAIDDVFEIDDKVEAVEVADFKAVEPAEPVENISLEPVSTEQEASQAAFPNPVNVETSTQGHLNLDRFPKPGDVNFLNPSGNPFPMANVSKTPVAVEPVADEELDLQAVEKEDDFSHITANPVPVDLTGDETILPVSNHETFDQIKSALEETGELNEKQNVDFTHIPESDETFMIADIDLADEMAAEMGSIPAPQPVLNEEFEAIEAIEPIETTGNEVPAPEVVMAADSTTLATTKESLASMLDEDFNLDDLDDDLT